MQSANLPLIDLLEAQSPDISKRREVARKIDQACREFGFFTVCGHGIPDVLFAELFSALTEYFDRPLEEKMESVATKSNFVRDRDDYTPYGYSATLAEGARAFMGDHAAPSDYVEKLSFGNRIINSPESCLLPSGDTGLRHRNIFRNYYIHCRMVSARIASLCALAFGMPEDFFESLIDRSLDSMRLHHFPPLQSGSDESPGMGAHMDGSLLTLVGETQSGLEVKLGDGRWLEARTEQPDHLIVNIGDLMARFVNNEWKSTEHRVVRTGRKRLSAVYFQEVNDEAILTVMEGACQTRPSEFTPVQYRIYREQKLYGSYA